METNIVKGDKKDINLLTVELKEIRLETLRKEDLPAYCVLNNSEMEDLIEKYPMTLEKLAGGKEGGSKNIDKCLQ